MIRLKCVTGDMVELDASTLLSANLDGKNLHRLIVRGQNFRGATFVEANLRNAILDHSQFVQSVFDSANMINSIARSCNFAQANFTGAKLLSAQFEWSDFTRACFRKADVEGASFKNCWLCGADFSEIIGIVDADFENAIYDAQTKWPEEFVPINAEAFEDMNGEPWN